MPSSVLHRKLTKAQGEQWAAWRLSLSNALLWSDRRSVCVCTFLCIFFYIKVFPEYNSDIREDENTDKYLKQMY